MTVKWFADQGFIVVAIDNRGTPGRGRDWERAIKHELRPACRSTTRWTALQALGEASCPELDLARVGIYGWSFGGYMSALAVMRRPDVFKAAVAGAPVADWRDYDTHYTERYLGLPRAEEPPTTDSLLTYAPKLGAPAAAHPRHRRRQRLLPPPLKLSDALFRAGRPFEFLPLAGETARPA